MLRRCDILGLDQNGGGHVAEDEMAVAVAPVEMTGADFRVNHQYRAGAPGPNIIGRCLDAESRRGASDIHVETKAVLHPDRVLYLHGDRRIGALEIGTGAEHRVDILRLASGPFKRLLGSLHSDFGENRDFFIRALGQSRAHDLRVENRFLGEHKARLDA